MFYIGLFIQGKHEKQILNLKPRGLDIWDVVSFSKPLPNLSKLYPFGQNWPASRGIAYAYVKLTFSEYNRVAYQLKGNEAYNNMLANILPSHTPFSGKRIFFSFLKVVILYIKLMRMKHKTQCKQIFCFLLTVDTLMGSKDFFMKKVMLNIKLQGKKSRTLCKSNV